MKIALKDIYGDFYKKDKCFDVEGCNIGENLLMPGIKLKKELEKEGHFYHTADMYKLEDIDVVVFQDVPQSILTVQSLKELIGYFVKKRYKDDILLWARKNLDKEKCVLIIMEPPTVWSKSYNERFYKYFGNVLTWNDELVVRRNFVKYYIPQYNSGESYFVSYGEKKLLTMICSNKSGYGINELYSERKKVIDYCEHNSVEFDLYGYGWNGDEISNYKGTVENKLETLSKYKFSVCYENMTGISGYVTEKIFDCFFAGTVPIYWGATNIDELIPTELYVDRRKFDSEEQMISYIKQIDEKRYSEMLNHTREYLASDLFNRTFSVDNYVSCIKNVLINKDNS